MTLQPATARCRPTTLQPLRRHAWRSLRPKSLEPNASPAPPPSRMNEIGRRICDQIGRVLRLSTTTCATMEQPRPWAVPRGALTPPGYAGSPLSDRIWAALPIARRKASSKVHPALGGRGEQRFTWRHRRRGISRDDVPSWALLALPCEFGHRVARSAAAPQATADASRDFAGSPQSTGLAITSRRQIRPACRKPCGSLRSSWRAVCACRP
jgi:hypothetical protein